MEPIMIERRLDILDQVTDEQNIRDAYKRGLKKAQDAAAASGYPVPRHSALLMEVDREANARVRIALHTIDTIQY